MLKKSCYFLCALSLGVGCLFSACSDSDDEKEIKADFQCVNSVCSCKGNGVHCMSDEVALVCKDSVLTRIKCDQMVCSADKGCEGESFNNEGDNKVSANGGGKSDESAE